MNIMVLISMCNICSRQQKMKQIKLFAIALCVVSNFRGYSCATAGLPPPCDDPIYCYGELLETVQMAHLYKDSKTFVDMKLKYSPEQVLNNFQLVMNKYNRHPMKEEVQKFVEANFDQPGTEFEPWNPTDWSPSPSFLHEIQDLKLRQYAEQLHYVWKDLGRKIKDDVNHTQDRYSIIYVPHPAIVPGGRFREFYYWDSYWIVRGLLISNMTSTVKGMLQNFLYMVDELGFVPNGGRVYYKMRSQPPFLIPMMESYLEYTKDSQFIKDSFATLEKEFDFWVKNRTINVEKDGVTYKMARYYVPADGPRPESYREDFLLVSQSNLSSSKQVELYQNLKAGAESGWDYSSRWFTDPKGADSLLHLRTQHIIPVDLNALLYHNAKLLSQWAKTLLGDTQKEQYYAQYAKDMYNAVQKVLWNEQSGVWFDYDWVKQEQRKHFYPSNIVPLWTKCYNVEDKGIVQKVISYLDSSTSLSYSGGIPSSLYPTGEQWDFPNSWAPLQYFIIMGLENTQVHEAQEMAYKLAEKWVRNNWESFLQSSPHTMFEKYDASIVGLPGGGGEYDVQMGFGWSNGVVLEFIHKYKDRLTSCWDQGKLQAATGHATTATPASMTTLTLVAILSAVAALAIG